MMNLAIVPEEASSVSRRLARQIRIHSLNMTNRGGASHVGAIFSCADILAVLYSGIMRVRPADPDWKDRDRFVLSKGHAGGGLYAVLAERGFFPVDLLEGYYQNGSELCGHVSHKLPGIDLSTGALGHGLSVAAGMAYAAKLGGKSHRVFCVLSDGECDEGSTWEAILFAGHHGMDNLVAIVDYNRIQGIGHVAEVLQLHPFAEKWESFGWSVREIDGHDHAALVAALAELPATAGRPTCLIANTVKGKGVSFMENTILWHYRIPQGAEFRAAMAELEASE